MGCRPALAGFPSEQNLLAEVGCPSHGYGYTSTFCVCAARAVSVTQPAQLSNCSILDTLDDSFRGDDGKFTFKLVWPRRSGVNYNTWKQTTNPVTQRDAVSGYEEVDVNFRGQHWGGLENGYRSYPNTLALLDGSVNRGTWWCEETKGNFKSPYLHMLKRDHFSSQSMKEIDTFIPNIESSYRKHSNVHVSSN